MAREPSDIARQFTEDLLKKQSNCNPEDVYRVINTLEEHPDLENVRLIASPDHSRLYFSIRAVYTGPEELQLVTEANKEAAQAAAKAFYQNISKKTGLTFYSECPTTDEPVHYVASVKVADNFRPTIAISKSPVAKTL